MVLALQEGRLPNRLGLLCAQRPCRVYEVLLENLEHGKQTMTRVGLPLPTLLYHRCKSLEARHKIAPPPSQEGLSSASVHSCATLD